MGTETENDDLKKAFNEIMGYWSPNNNETYDGIVEAYKRGNIIPFVGAGLSCFCGYETWPNALKSMAASIGDSTVQKSIGEKIDKNHLVEAAQELWEKFNQFRGNGSFEEKLKKIFALGKIDDCRNNQKDLWKSSAAYMLPKLFKYRPVVTTNFDKVLEAIFSDQEAQEGKERHAIPRDLVTPYDVENQRIDQVLQGNLRAIFKLHGDIGEAVDFKKIVFRQEEYDDVYAEQFGVLTTFLTRLYENKQLLFLGCSLEKDKTLERFNKIYAPRGISRQQRKGIKHYAIVPCKNSDCKERATTLKNNYGISAIFYPPGEYNDVRVILERLKIDTENGIEREPINVITGNSKIVPIVKPTLKKENFKIFLPGSVELEMIWVDPTKPEGFLMGSSEGELGRREDEKRHPVILTKGFWLGKYPVTQIQYEAVMGENPSRFKGDNLPVERVSWYDAMKFCEEVTQIEKKVGRLPEGYEYTLPTEAQWEYACRAGTITALNSGKNLTSGNGNCSNLDEVGLYRENSGSKTHPVGEKKPNAWGFYDMHGNVLEWCLDRYGGYPLGSVTDPKGPDEGSRRVVRGGSWLNLADGCRSAYRYYSAPSGSGYISGFRVALSPVQ